MDSLGSLGWKQRARRLYDRRRRHVVAQSLHPGGVARHRHRNRASRARDPDPRLRARGQHRFRRICLGSAVLGITREEINEKVDAIIEFSGISDFINQPVKFYSSGMTVRLAFSIATSVSPEILVIDEAFGPCGIASEIAARVSEKGFNDLDAPVKCLTGDFTPTPYSPSLEAAVVPNVDHIEDSIRQLINE